MTQPLHVGIDGREWRDPSVGGATGVAQYLFHLVQALAELPLEKRSGVRFTLFFSSGTPVPGFLDGLEGFSVRSLSSAVRIPFFGPHISAARAFRAAEVDILHGPANVLPLAWHGPAILTVHDLLIYDHPEWFPSGQWLSTKIVVPRSIRQARRLIVPSEAVRESLGRHFPGSEKKTVVVSHGWAPLPTTSGEESAWNMLCNRFSFLVGNRLILSLGTIEPRKNCVRLVQAFESLRASLPDVQLVFAGKEGWGMPEDFLKRLPKGVHALGSISELEKAALLHHASILAYPSLAEGFGLPLLEAMGEGVPVVTSAREPMKSVSGRAGFFCDPESVQSIASALREALTNTSLITERVQEGKEQASRFSWEKTVMQTLKVYRSLAVDV